MKAETDSERFRRFMTSFGENYTWDEQTKKLANSTRAFLCHQPARTISEIQRASLKSRPIPNESLYHIVNQELPVPPQDDVRQLFLEAVKAIEDVEFIVPELVPVQVESISLRHGGESNSREGSSQALDGSTMNKARDLEMLHFHGGGHFQSDPTGYRQPNAKLATLTGGRVTSVRYRLAPQNEFPAPLLDAFLVYMSLLYPPPGSASKAIKPSRMVLIGDSSGATLIYGLLWIVDHLNTRANPCQFHNHKIQYPIPFPAGTAIVSPAGEQIQAFPTQTTNSVNDLYPSDNPWSLRSYPKCDLWPAVPPRPHIACQSDALRSPLTTPALARRWQGFPPMWIALGEEKWYDGAKIIARQATQAGVNVTWTEYEAMPHCFCIMPGFNKYKQTSHLMQKWARFCVDCVEGRLDSRGERVQASSVAFKTLVERPIPLEKESDVPLEKVHEIHETKRLEEERIWDESGPDAGSHTSKL